MIKYVGCADVPGNCLKYYVLGSSRQGYRIMIIQNHVEKKHCYVSRNLGYTLGLARKLQRCSVFPMNLLEIMEDLLCGEDSD